MIKKSEIEMERASLIKTTRTLLRLKASLSFDKELNDILPDQLEEFDAGIQSGELRTLSIDLLKELLGDA